MQVLIYMMISVMMGAIISLYLQMNSSVSRYLGSVMTASAVFYAIGFLTISLVFFIFGEPGMIGRVKTVPPYLYLGGIASAFVIIGTTFLLPYIGARKFFILLITGQILMAILISHFGVLESPKDPISLKKALGALFVIIGAFITTY